MRQTGRKNTTACQSAALDVADIALIVFVFVFQSACDESIHHVLSKLCIYVDLNSCSISVCFFVSMFTNVNTRVCTRWNSMYTYACAIM